MDQYSLLISSEGRSNVIAITVLMSKWVTRDIICSYFFDKFLQYLTFYRRHFPYIFSWKKSWYSDSKFIAAWIEIQIDNESSLVQILVWCLIGSNPSPKQMTTQFSDAYTRYLASMRYGSWPNLVYVPVSVYFTHEWAELLQGLCQYVYATPFHVDRWKTDQSVLINIMAYNKNKEHSLHHRWRFFTANDIFETIIANENMKFGRISIEHAE